MTTNNRINTVNMCYPPFVYRLIAGVKAANKAGIPLEVFETFRTFERQSSLYSQGRDAPGKIVTKARPGRSLHNYGVAADLVLKIDGKWSWEHEDLYVKAAPYLESCGLRWLGRNKKFFELVHYELPIDLSVYELENTYKQGGLVGVWLRFNERFGDRELWKS